MSSSELLSQNKECWVSGSQQSKYHKYPTIKYPNIYSVKGIGGNYQLTKPKGFYKMNTHSNLWFWQGFNKPYVNY